MTVAVRTILSLLGAVLIMAGAAGALQTRRFIAGAAQGDGTVTRLNAGGSHPQIDFHLQGGATVSYPQGGMIMGFRVGQPVSVLYDPMDPARTARVRSFGSLWGGSLALGMCGAGVLALALASRFFPAAIYGR